VSDWKKSGGTAGQWKHTAGQWYGDKEEDKGIQTYPDARFFATSSKFDSFSNEGKDLVLQFSVKHEQSLDCGGGYIKLLPSSLNQKSFSGDSDYSIMFGPDICGTGTRKVHVIFNYKGKNLLTKKAIECKTDQLSHVYTLIVRPDKTYEVRIDGEKKEGGNLLEDFDFLPPKMIKDPSVSKPADWVDEPMMDDSNDKKPEDWDSIPRQIPDPEAERPADWDDEADGEWEAPMIDNPEWKGEWKPAKIKNPAYKGQWVHPEIPNPEFQEDESIGVYPDSGAVGFELWQVKAGSIFDNIIVTDSVDEASTFMAQTWGAHKDAEKSMFDAAEKLKREKDEADRKKAEEERKKAEEDEDEDEDEDDEEEEEEEDDAPSHDEL